MTVVCLNIPEVVSQVLQFLSWRDFCSTALVCRTWHVCTTQPASRNRHVELQYQICTTQHHLSRLYSSLPFESRDPFLNSTAHFIDSLVDKHHDEQLSRVRTAMGHSETDGGFWTALMNQPLNFEEKRKLSVAINNLPRIKLGRVVEILERRRHLGERQHNNNNASSSSSSSAGSNAAGANAQSGGTGTGSNTATSSNRHAHFAASAPMADHSINDSIEVDLDNLDTQTMRELELYVRNVLAQMPRKRISKVRKRVTPRVTSNSSASETLSGDSSDHYQDYHYSDFSDFY